MKTIHKYHISSASAILIPKGAQILSVGAQGEDVCLWAVVDTEAEKVPCIFRVMGTGEDLDHFFPGMSKYDFIGTAHTAAGYVWHVWAECQGA